MALSPLSTTDFVEIAVVPPLQYIKDQAAKIIPTPPACLSARFLENPLQVSRLIAIATKTFEEFPHSGRATSLIAFRMP
jgi:hypothetical protein